ncbi:MAG: Glycosyltransferase-like protein [Planctomycetota bacterium]|nr:MAG: Glycosyltransferase-like protein [Planctomycetota bacterium]
MTASSSPVAPRQESQITTDVLAGHRDIEPATTFGGPAAERQGYVLHVRVVTGTGGGPEKTILNSPRFLKSLGYDCACAYLHPPSDPGFATLQQRATESQAELISVPDRGATDWRVVRQLLRICRERNVTIWHGHDHKSNAIGLLLRRFHPMKLVSTVHGWIVTNRKLAAYRQVDLACLRRYDEVICVSDALFDECLAAGVPLERCRVVENAIDLSQYRDLPDRASARMALDLSNDGHVVVAVGRLSPEKAFDVLIRSVDQLIEAGTNVRLLIAGEGSERPILERLIEQTGRGERIKLLGHVADPRSLFAAADAFVLSSRHEGLPNVLLESLACGVPVVATAVGGVPRVIADEVNGLLVRPDDVDGLSVALSRLLHNEALKSSLSVAGRRTLEERYSFDARMRKIVAVYDGSRERRLGTLTRPKERRDGQECPTSEVSVTAHPAGWREFLATHGDTGFQQWPEWSHALARN